MREDECLKMLEKMEKYIFLEAVDFLLLSWEI